MSFGTLILLRWLAMAIYSRRLDTSLIASPKLAATRSAFAHRSSSNPRVHVLHPATQNNVALATYDEDGERSNALSWPFPSI